MADILFPDSTPQGSAATFGTPAPAAPDTKSAALPQDDPGGHGDSKQKDGGKKGGLGGFLTSPLGEILGPVLIGGLTALTGGAAAPLLGLDVGLGAAAGGALGAGLEQGIVNKSPVSGVLGALGGAAEGFGGSALLGAVGPSLGLTAAGAAAPAAAGGAGSAAGAAAPAGAGTVAAPLTSAAGATDPLAGLLGAGGALGPAGVPGAVGDVGSAALAPTAFGAASDPTAAALGGAAATTGAGGTAPAAGGGGALSELLAGHYGAAAGDLGSWLAKNPSLVLGGVGSLASMLQPQEKVPGLDMLTKNQKTLGRFGASAINAEQTGNLPPGAEQFVENALHDEEARIRGSYASLGLSGSTMEAQDLAAASERAAANRFQIASTVTNQGLSALGASGSEAATLAQLQLAQDQKLQEAIASFSSALGYGQGLTRIPTVT